MEEIKNLTCIHCPMGCFLEVLLRGGEVVSVSGNTCVRGEGYAREEVIHPRRVLTSTVRVLGGNRRTVSVKTREEIPKEKIEEVMDVLWTATVRAPVAMGDVIIANVAETGVDILATATVTRMLEGRKP